MHGMVEVMRGCGRGCKFCDVTLRSLRYYSPEKVKKEIEVNIKKGGSKSAWIHSDDIFVYGMDPRTAKGMEPNREALRGIIYCNYVYWSGAHKSNSWNIGWCNC